MNFSTKLIFVLWPLTMSCSSSASDNSEKAPQEDTKNVSTVTEAKSDSKSEETAVVKVEPNVEAEPSVVVEPTPEPKPVDEPEPIPAVASPAENEKKGLTLVSATDVWEKAKIAECKFEVRAGKQIRDRLLAQSQSCENLEAMKAAVAGYLPTPTALGDEDHKALQGCSRPVATAEFMDRFAQMFVDCRTKDFPVERKEKFDAQVQKVYSFCQSQMLASFENENEISLKNVDLSPYLSEELHLRKPLATLFGDAVLFERLTKVSDSISAKFSGEPKLICSIAINDFINGQTGRSFHE